MSARLTDLLDEHRRFADALGAIRLDVHGRRLHSARVRLAWLADALASHIALEEDQLMPVFRTLDHPVPNGAPDVFLRDHALIRRLLGEATAALARDEPVELADALAQLDGVLEHHDLREETYFKARLDGAMPPEDRAAILAAHPDPGPPPGGSDAVTAPPRPPDGTELDHLRWDVATGDLATALDDARRLQVPAGKGERQRLRVVAALETGDVLAAWDAVRLLTFSLAHFPVGDEGLV